MHFLGEKLKACPFCGGKPLWFEDDRIGIAMLFQEQRTYGIMCGTEGCILNEHHKTYRTRLQAQDAWNQRVEDTNPELDDDAKKMWVLAYLRNKLDIGKGEDE